MIKVLMIDDDRKLGRLVREYLVQMGFAVTLAYDGESGLELLRGGGFAAVLLDVMLPDIDGFEVLRRLRRESAVPVLMFTARGEETDRIVGLEMGADDYLPKTFSSRELLARLRAVIRRSRNSPVAGGALENETFRVGELEIDVAARSLKRAGEKLELTALEYDLFMNLYRNRGRVLSRDRLLELVAGRDYTVFDRSIDVHISSLRRKLGDDPRDPVYIRTVRGAGYMFVREVSDRR
jgi:two-component system response regulator CpxR